MLLTESKSLGMRRSKSERETLHFQQTKPFDLNVSASQQAFKNVPAYKHYHRGKWKTATALHTNGRRLMNNNQTSSKEQRVLDGTATELPHQWVSVCFCVLQRTSRGHIIKAHPRLLSHNCSIYTNCHSYEEGAPLFKAAPDTINMKGTIKSN